MLRPEMTHDIGQPVHYSAVERGTPVYSSDGVEVGRVDEVIDNYREHILDGFVIETPDRKLVFADAPEVARTGEQGVTLTIDAEAAAALPAPDPGAPSFKPRRAGRIGRMFGGNWRKH
jgi:hypothetical protein